MQWVKRHAVPILAAVVALLVLLQIPEGIALIHHHAHLKRTSQRLDTVQSEMRDAAYSASLLRLSVILERSLPRHGSVFDEAVELRNNLYTDVPLKATPSNFDFDAFADAYQTSVRDDSVGHICGGLAIIYVSELEAMGIPARLVNFYSTNHATKDMSIDGHSTVEFYDHGHWIASDPTFNVMFMKDGKYLSYEDLYKLVHAHQSYEITTNGKKLLPHRDIRQYYISLDKLLTYVSIQPSRVIENDTYINTPQQFLPPTWDGRLTYLDGHSVDGTANSEMFQFLAKGPLR